MERIILGLLIVVGLVNFLPVAGILSVEILANVHGIAVPEGDLLVLMRHRALLFGILGAIAITSAFHRHLQSTAIVAGLISMLGFIGLALSAGEYGPKLHKVVLVNVIAAVGLVAVALLRFRKLN